MRERILQLSLLLPVAFGVARAQAPDLIVRSEILARHWVIREEFLDASFCSVVEGGITPGNHILLRFTVTTPNVGDSDLALGDPNAHFTPYGDPSGTSDGTYEFAACHRHFHFRHYALYQLIDATTGFVWKAAKRGFCMIDVDPNPGYFGRAPGPRRFDRCGAPATATSPAIPGNQGISAGWADTYVFLLGGQYFVLDGGDGQPAVPPGEYILRITVNPPFTPGAGETCPYLDGAGFCHTLPESDYSNNVGETRITVPNRVGRTGVGPAPGGNPPTGAEPVDHP